MASKRAAPINWSYNTQLYATVRRGKLSRVVSITAMADGSFLAVGLEVPGAPRTLAEVLGNHNHCDLGAHGSERKARAACRAFLLAPRARRSKRCECGEAS